MGSFLFKWPHPDANDVHVTGTFDDWGKTEKLNKIGDIWEKEVELPNADKKILYKFVVNDNWVIDPEAPQEDDGHGNLNNVLHPEQIKTKSTGVTTSSVAPESTTSAMAGQVPLEERKEATEVTPASDSSFNKETTKSSPPGAFPETPQHESDSFGVNPLPPTEGAGNPVNVPAGEKVPAPEQITSNSIYSSVTTSEGDYEKAGSSLPFIGGALASLGLGGGAVATSSDRKENLIPESSLPMGEGAGTALEGAGPTISSAAPTSTTADLAGQVPLEERKPATVIERDTTETVPEIVKESITAAHTSGEATTSPEAVKEKAEVEQELLKKVPETDEAGEPAPTVAAATSETAPSSTAGPSSGAIPGTSSVAAAAIADGAEGGETQIEAPKTTHPVEKTEGDTTEYAPPQHTGVAPGVSGSAAAAVSDGTEDPTLADEPAVRMMNQNDAMPTGSTEATPAATSTGTTAGAPAHDVTTTAEAPKTAAAESKQDTTATPSSATSTPKKAATTTPTSSPASASKEKKKKNRISSLFKKIFD
ncbi:Cruciform DNA binding protein [Exophiala xenobiotica]|nr:Cruciform DNA binding protein [Exophiala xenobiotica]